MPANETLELAVPAWINMALAITGLFQRIRSLNSLSSPLWKKVDFGGRLMEMDSLSAIDSKSDFMCLGETAFRYCQRTASFVGLESFKGAMTSIALTTLKTERSGLGRLHRAPHRFFWIVARHFDITDRA